MAAVTRAVELRELQDDDLIARLREAKAELFNLRVQGATVSAMTEAMRCRGPDAHGTWLSERAAFGHRRLAVIDIAGGVQPMQASHAESPPAVLTYSGEVYNCAE